MQVPIVKKQRPLEYVSVTLIRDEILNVLETAFASISSGKGKFFRQLQQNGRVQPEFHVTLIHRAAAAAHPTLWQKYSERHEQAGDAGDAGNKLGVCQVLLERIVWDNRIMTIVARLVGEDWECANEVAHVTVGTSGPEVKPKESNDLLKRWLLEGSGDESGIGEVAIEGRHVVDGVVRGILSR
jgi:tRNA ligase